MAFTRLNRLARHQRRRLAIVVIMLGLGGAVAVAHSALADDHMGDGTAMCLAVMSAGAIALVALAAAPPEPRTALHLAPRARLTESAALERPDLPPARAGPALLQVFLR